MSSEEKIDTDMLLAYMRGELSDEQKQFVDHKLNVNPSWAAEFAIMNGTRKAQAQLRSSIKGSELGWARLSHSIDKTYKATEEAGTSSEELKAASNWRGAGWRALSRPVELWQAAACAMLGIAAWQFIVLPAASPSQPDAVFAPVSGVNVEGQQLRVMFAEETTEEEMRTLINRLNANIVAGPSAIGFYTLSFEDDQSKHQAEDQLKEAEIIERVQSN